MSVREVNRDASKAKMIAAPALLKNTENCVVLSKISGTKMIIEVVVAAMTAVRTPWVPAPGGLDALDPLFKLLVNGFENHPPRCPPAFRPRA